jgi:hypothetical protein
LHQSTRGHESLYTDRSSNDEQLFIRPFLHKKKKYKHGGRLNVTLRSLFCGDNSRTVVLRQMNFGIVRDHEHTYKVYLNHFLCFAVFKYGDGAKL